MVVLIHRRKTRRRLGSNLRTILSCDCLGSLGLAKRRVMITLTEVASLVATLSRVVAQASGADRDFVRQRSFFCYTESFELETLPILVTLSAKSAFKFPRGHRSLHCGSGRSEGCSRPPTFLNGLYSTCGFLVDVHDMCKSEDSLSPFNLF